MNPTLKSFQDHEAMREAVKDFMMGCVNELAIEKVMKRENTESIADAKEIIEKAFIKLKELYATAPKPKRPNSR